MSILSSKIYIDDLKFAVDNTDVLDSLSGKSIFITGGTGLIGSGVVDLLLMANSIKNLDIKILLASRDIPKAESRFLDFPDKEVLKNIAYIQYDATKTNTLQSRQ